jgi:hypothetical protein
VDELTKEDNFSNRLPTTSPPFPFSSRDRVTFSIFFCISNQLYFKPPNKAVILSEALRKSIANTGLYGAESKDPGDACWQMLLGAFQPRTTTED